jgi:Flp pilus assembly protein TadD
LIKKIFQIIQGRKKHMGVKAIQDDPAMSDKFHFSLRKPPWGEPVSAEEVEAYLLQSCKECEERYIKILWQLVEFFSATGRAAQAVPYLQKITHFSEDPEKLASCYLAMGQLMEKMDAFESAILVYRKAFDLDPTICDTWYLINNNLGYCLNQVGKHEEAEQYCRAAIKIDPERCNAYKNLGVSLEGQSRFADAARYFLLAIRKNVADSRSLAHLEKLVSEQKEFLLQAIPNLDSELEQCREAVNKVADLQRELMHQHENQQRKNNGNC